MPACMAGHVTPACVHAVELAARALHVTCARDLTDGTERLQVELAARALHDKRRLRLVSVTSSAAFDSRLGERDRLDLSWEARAFDSRQAYVDSKACGSRGLHACACMHAGRQAGVT